MKKGYMCPMKKMPLSIRKLEKMGNTIGQDVKIEKKAGMPSKFKVPRVKIKW